MAEQNPSLHIDTDWKKQAQEEKRKLAEEQKQKADAAKAESAASAKPQSGEATARPGAGAGAKSASREMPPASFATLVQSVVTQALFYLGDLAVRGGEPVVNLEMAKHQIDLLGILEEKTANNLAPEEQKLLDAALYEARMRYVAVASQYLGP